MTDWTKDARAFDAKTPKVWELFRRFAFEAINAGHKHLGSKTIFERIRWYTTVETAGTVFKLNNNHTAHYARKFAACYPEREGFFRTRGKGQ